MKCAESRPHLGNVLEELEQLPSATTLRVGLFPGRPFPLYVTGQQVGPGCGPRAPQGALFPGNFRHNRHNRHYRYYHANLPMQFGPVLHGWRRLAPGCL